MQRPTGPTCDGCHSTNYEIATKEVTDRNAGCEKCREAGGAHAATLARNRAMPCMGRTSKLDLIKLSSALCIVDDMIGDIAWPSESIEIQVSHPDPATPLAIG